jgi:hypothetical protein
VDRFTRRLTSIHGKLAGGLSVGDKVMKESLMSKRAHAAVAVVASALMMGAFAIGAVAQQAPAQQPPGYEGGPGMVRVPEPMISLTGMLQSDGAEGWMLVDQASGDSITLKKKSKKLAEHDQTNVTVTGYWKKNDETTKTFKVSKVEAAPAAAETTETAAPAATHAESPATPEAVPSIPEDTGAPTDPSVPDPAIPEDTSAPEQQPLPNAPESPAPSTP